MNFAHIVGDHQADNSLQLASHLLISWAGIAIASIIVCTAVYFLYRKFKVNFVKQRSNNTK